MSRQVITRDAVLQGVKAGATPASGLLRKSVVADSVEPIDGSDRTLRFTISTSSVDRDNDVVSALGWDLENFKKNPVVLWAHDYSMPPVAKATRIGIEGGRLVADAQFIPASISAFAESVFQMLKGGYLRATSVGFQPKLIKLNEERGGLDFEEQELLEFSIVPVPANPEALIEARAAGIDTAPLKAWAQAVIKGLKTVPAEERAAEAATVAELERAAAALSEGDPKVEAPVKVGDIVATLRLDTTEATKALDAILAKMDAAEKRGRVLSSANEGRIRRAVEMLGEVLQQLAEEPTEPVQNPDDGKAAKAEKDGMGPCGFVDGGDGTACSHMATENCTSCGAPMCGSHVHSTGVCMACGAKAAPAAEQKDLDVDDEVALDLDEDHDGLDISDAAPGSVELSVNPEDLRAAIALAVADSVGKLEQVVRAETAAAINRARGRVD